MRGAYYFPIKPDKTCRCRVTGAHLIMIKDMLKKYDICIFNTINTHKI